MSSKASRYFGIGFVLVAVGSVAACSSSDSPATGGTAGTGAGGSGTAGTSSGMAGTGTAGTGTAGTTGTGTAGTTGTGTAGSGGAGGGAPVAACTAPTAASVTSFADLVANATSAGNFNFTAGLPGGTYSYQTGELTLADTGMALNAKGTVKNYDGFGIYINNCQDASAYTGVSFNIKGNVGPSNKISFRIHTFATTPNLPTAPGGCAVPAGTTDTYPLCHAAAFEIPVSAAGGVVNVLFSDLTMGVPVAGVNGKDINGFEWAFEYMPPAATGGAGGADGSFPVDVTVDDIKFTGGTGPVGGGGTGAGGASGGTGGASTAGTGGASGGTGGTHAGAGGA